MSPLGAKSRLRRSFTLLEAVLYLALVGVLFLGLIYFLLGATNSRAKSIAITEVEDNGRIALNQIARLVRSAVNIDWSRSQLETHPGTLVINADDNKVYEISVDTNGSLNISENGLSDVLTSNLVKVTNFVLERYDDQTVGIALGLRYWPQADNLAFNYQNSWQSTFRIVK